MSLKCLIPVKVEFDMGDLWCDEEGFRSMSRKELIELFEEDILGFIDSLGGLQNLTDKMEFIWE